jgi:hypothetical protein
MNNMCDKTQMSGDSSGEIRIRIHYNTHSQDRQCKHKGNNEASSYHCCRGKAISITYSECVFVAFGTACNLRLIVICVLSGCTIFSTLSGKWHYFRKKLLNTEYVF